MSLFIVMNVSYEYNNREAELEYVRTTWTIFSTVPSIHFKLFLNKQKNELSSLETYLDLSLITFA